jgi:D-arginine dehydrogenase
VVPEILAVEPKFQGAVEADVAIVGGGIAGASAAWALSPHARVVVLEAEEGVGVHSTGRSAAVLTETYEGDLIRQVTHAARSILDHEFAAVEGLLQERGVLWVASPGQEASLTAVVGGAAGGPAPYRTIGPDGLLEICGALRGELCIGGLLEPGAKAIDVDRLHQEFLRRAKSAGARIITNCRIERITRERSSWMLESAGFRVRASSVIDAAGAWADQVAAMADVEPARLVPLRRTAFLFPSRPGDGHEGWPFTIDVDETWYFEPHGPVMLGSNCDEHPDTPRDVRAEDIDVAEAIEKINAVTNLGIARVLKQWAGLRTFAEDRLPVIGPDRNAPRFHWYAGLGGFGIMTAAALGRTVAELVIEDGESSWTRAVSTQCSVTRLRRSA